MKRCQSVCKEINILMYRLRRTHFILSEFHEIVESCTMIFILT